MHLPRALHVLAAALLLSGCASDSLPMDADAPDASAPGEERFEPLVFEGTVSGGADCMGEGWLPDFQPVTPEAIRLPPEAWGRLYRLSLTPSATAPDLGATCMLFSDGTLKDAGETDVGRVPEGVTWVQVITNANVLMGYRLTVE